MSTLHPAAAAAAATVATRRRPGGEAGFSLIELLVAMTVTVIGLAGLLAVQVATVKGNLGGANLAEANVMCQQSIEQLRSMSMTEMQAKYGMLPIAGVDLGTMTGRAGQTYKRSLSAVELTAASADLVRLRVDVTWTEGGAAVGAEGGRYDHRLSLEFIRTRQEAL